MVQRVQTQAHAGPDGQRLAQRVMWHMEEFWTRTVRGPEAWSGPGLEPFWLSRCLLDPSRPREREGLDVL